MKGFNKGESAKLFEVHTLKSLYFANGTSQLIPQPWQYFGLGDLVKDGDWLQYAFQATGGIPRAVQRLATYIQLNPSKKASSLQRIDDWVTLNTYTDEKVHIDALSDEGKQHLLAIFSRNPPLVATMNCMCPTI